MKKRTGIIGICLTAAMLCTPIHAEEKAAPAVPSGDPGIQVVLPEDPYWGKITPEGERQVEEFRRKTAGKFFTNLGKDPALFLPDGEPEKAEAWIYDYSYSPVAYHVTDLELLKPILNALKETNSQLASKTPINGHMTGIDRSQYIPLWGLELKWTGQDVEYGPMRYCFNDDSFILDITHHNIGEFKCEFYQGAGVSKVIEQFKEIKKKVPSRYRAFELPEQNSIYLYNNQTKVYSDADDAPAKVRKELDAAFSALHPRAHTQKGMIGKAYTGLDNIVQYLPNGTFFEYSFHEKGISVKGSLTESGLESVQEYEIPEKEYQALLDVVRRTDTGLAKHPYWLGKLVNRRYFMCRYKGTAADGNADQTPVIDDEKMKELLKTVVVNADGYQSAKPNAKIANPQFVFEIRDTTNYTITVSDTQLLIANDTMDYATLYRLANGKELVSQMKKTLKVF